MSRERNRVSEVQYNLVESVVESNRVRYSPVEPGRECGRMK